MASIVLENEAVILSVDEADLIPDRPVPDPVDTNATLEELGIWLSGVQSYLRSRRPVRNGEAITEFQIVRSAIQRCVLLNARVTSEVVLRKVDLPSGITVEGLRELAYDLREAALAGDAVIRANSLTASEWQAWAELLCAKLDCSHALKLAVHNAELAGEQYLPDQLLAVVKSRAKAEPEMKELAHVLPRFGKVLKWLSVVGELLDRDEPMKASLVIFSSVNEQVLELTRDIDRRLEGLKKREAELVSSLDAAAYTASIELKKVFSQELAGLSEIRPAPTVFAKMETAFSLLTEGFQHMLAGFARLIDGQSDVFALFPNFHIKLERSLVLRNELWRVIDAVRKAETVPEKAQVENVQTVLMDFVSGPVRYLFYKDTETVERFIEEILLTRGEKDLVPLLHRFGAYLETLFGQVCLRAVLVDHPFAPAR